MNAKIEFANSIQSIKVRDFLLLNQRYNNSYLLVPNNYKEMDVTPLFYHQIGLQYGIYSHDRSGCLTIPRILLPPSFL